MKKLTSAFFINRKCYKHGEVREMKNKILTGILFIGIGAIAIGFFQAVLKQPLWTLGILVLIYILVTIKNKIKLRRR
jgi:hypothetical protein